MLNENNLVVNSAGHILQVHPLGENEDSDFNQGPSGAEY